MGLEGCIPKEDPAALPISFLEPPFDSLLYIRVQHQNKNTNSSKQKPCTRDTTDEPSSLEGSQRASEDDVSDAVTALDSAEEFSWLEGLRVDRVFASWLASQV